MKKWVWAIAVLLSACQASVSTVSPTASAAFGSSTPVSRPVPAEFVIPQLNLKQGTHLLYLASPQLDYLSAAQESHALVSIVGNPDQINSWQIRLADAKKPIESMVVFKDGKFKTNHVYQGILFDLNFMQFESNDYFKILNAALDLLEPDGTLVVAGEKTDNWLRDYVEAIERLAEGANSGQKLFKKMAIEQEFSATHFTIIIIK
ncbi:MAG: hypothetical protein ACK417_08620 [Bacteroidia bacterium]